ncbi:hypothetical protein N7478_007435 [Penicillium angulare]|uniref:uncharacterized protein n=1 Tax=Penicillium angulare TaxID=116970 RepID=UPI002540008D|nr:uncharacterized protein N7478_007435 [Penicillium angulare]KAJ5272310.1 hypothetical protein N7478_007435 [Penicillium angulare]
MHSYIRPLQYCMVQLPSDQLKLIRPVPNTIVQLGKYGSFAANQILGRPFYLTFEILDTPEPDGYGLRIVSATELHAETLIEEAEADGEGDDGEPSEEMRTNKGINDDNSAQRLTMEEIEELKKESGAAGRDIVAKIMESHSTIDQKTAFSLAKYTLRKRKKYIKRFTILPLDVSVLANYMLAEKDAGRTMELRDEHIGLLGCLGNVHSAGTSDVEALLDVKPNGRYIVVDDTGGLIVAAMAERMGILYPHDEDEEDQSPTGEALPSSGDGNQGPQSTTKPSRRQHIQGMTAFENTITVISAQSQPNLSLLKYFGYDTSSPDETHPLHTHLKSISWLQLVDPSRDPIISAEPPIIPDAELAEMKSNKRQGYYFKRNRWSRNKAVADEARAGGFNGLIVGTLFEPSSVLKHVVPLLAGSSQVSIYSPNIEPLVELMDLYSVARRTAFINRKRDLESRAPVDGEADLSSLYEEFTLNPSLILSPSLHHIRVRPWQVLPGRTHPMMTGRGGAEGYLFHAIRVIPAEDNVQAAGNFRKKRKLETTSTPASDKDIVML